MVENTYENAYTEILEILKFFPDEVLRKIPKDVILFFKKNCNKGYNYKYDFTNPVYLRKTEVLIVMLYKNYIATQDEKKNIEEILIINGKINNLKRNKK